MYSVFRNLVKFLSINEIDIVLDIHIDTYIHMKSYVNLSLVAAILIYCQFPSYIITKDEKLIYILYTQEIV